MRVFPTQHNKNSTDFLKGLGKDQITQIATTPAVNDGFELEEIDLEFEQLQDQELEGPNGPDENDFEILHGDYISFQRALTGKVAASWDDRRIQKLLAKSSNLYDIPVAQRGTVYRYFEKMIDKKIFQEGKQLLHEYEDIIKDLQITKVSRCNP